MYIDALTGLAFLAGPSGIVYWMYASNHHLAMLCSYMHQYSHNILAWLNATVFVTLVRKIMQQLLKCDHYSILEDNIYTNSVEIHCDTN